MVENPEAIKNLLREQLLAGKDEKFLRDSLVKANIPEIYLDEVLSEKTVTTPNSTVNTVQNKSTVTPTKDNSAPIKGAFMAALPEEYLTKHSEPKKVSTGGKIAYMLLGLLLYFGINFVLNSLDLSFGYFLVFAIIFSIKGEFRKKPIDYLARGLVIGFVIDIIVTVLLIVLIVSSVAAI